MFRGLCSVLLLFNVSLCVESSRESIQPKAVDSVRFIAYDKGFYSLIDTTQRAILLYDKGVWLEGVQALPNGDVVASDVKQNMLLTFHGLDVAGELDSHNIESICKAGKKREVSENTESKGANSKDSKRNSLKTQAQSMDCAPTFQLSILKPSHFQNGHALDLQGRLIAASHGKRGIERLEHGAWQLLVDSYNGGKLNSPNDVVVGSRGDVWFSDPRFGLRNPLEGYGGEDMQGGDYLYRLSILESRSAKHTPNTAESKYDLQASESHSEARKSADSKDVLESHTHQSSQARKQGKNTSNADINQNELESHAQGDKRAQSRGNGEIQITRLHAKGLQAPNGLAFSPDEKLLYVADSARAYDFNDKSLPAQILVYKVNADRSLGAGRVFARIDSGIPDEIKVDSYGNVWSSSARGIVVFAPRGKKLGEIVFPELVGNLTFSLSRTQKLALQKQGVRDVALPNQKGKRLYVTSGSKLYMLEVKVESGIKR